MLILRLKQAECALADGRLDEAAELLGPADIRGYRRGQELAGAAARALVDRGRKHLAAGRLYEADADCQKACRLAGNAVEATQLRAAVATAMRSVQHDQQQKMQAMEAARQQMRRGEFSLGQKALEGIQEHSPEAQLMHAELANRRAEVDALAGRAEEALKRDDWEAAMELLASAGPAVADLRLRELATRTADRINERIDEAMNEGRLDLAMSLVHRMNRVAQRDVRTEQHRRTLEQCRVAWQKIRQGQLAEAGEILQRLQAAIGPAKWLVATIADLEQAEGAMRRLRGGMIATLEDVAAEPQKRAAEPRPMPPPLPERPEAKTPLASRFLLQVDGVGAFLVLRDRCISVGPISGAQPCDVGIMAEAATPAVSIERTDEDYVLSSTGANMRDGSPAVMVNERPIARKLLADGDRIALSQRCRLQFRRPSPASASAILDLTGARLARADVRRVILMDRELIIGPGPAAHVRCDDLAQSILLCVRDGQLVCQAKSDVYVDEHAAGRLAAIGAGCHVRVGDLRLVVTSA